MDYVNYDGWIDSVQVIPYEWVGASWVTSFYFEQEYSPYIITFNSIQ